MEAEAGVMEGETFQVMMDGQMRPMTAERMQELLLQYMGDQVVGREEYLHTIDMLFERVKKYIDEQVGETRQIMAQIAMAADQGLNECHQRLTNLEVADGTVPAYRAWVVSEARRLEVKPSEVVVK